MTTIRVKNLVIGGGFAGLFLGTVLQDATIIESDMEIGGLLRGFKSKTGKYTFDIGGHVYTSRDAYIKRLMKEADGTFFPERKAYFDFQKKVPYPVQYHADQLEVKVKTSKLSKYDTFGSLLRHEFGRQMFDEILEPFNERVWSTRPDLMSSDWITGRVPLMDEEKDKWGSNSSFYYARGEDILRVMRRRMIENVCDIRRGLKVIRVDVGQKLVVATHGHDHKYVLYYHYDNLFDTSGIMLEGTGCQLPYNDVVTIGLGLNRAIEDDFHWWYNGTDNVSPIHRITLLSRYHHKMAPEGVDSLLIEVPLYRRLSRSFVNATNEKRHVVYLLKLANSKLGIEEGDIEEMSIIASKGYPIPVISHREKVAKARLKFSRDNIYLVGRWGGHEYLNLDHIVKGCLSAAAYASGKSDINDYSWSNWYYKESRRFE